MEHLIQEIKNCTVCQSFLPYPPKPVFQVSELSKIIIIGQAPGQKVQTSGIPWDDLSGNELRRWLGVKNEQFYDSGLFALMPMGFCYPGKGTSGDLPPRQECAPLWHEQILKKLGQVRLTLLIGQYAQKYYLKDKFNTSITENVKNYKDFLPRFLPLVHPSPRNKIWQKKNPWFEAEIVPELRSIVSNLLQ